MLVYGMTFTTIFAAFLLIAHNFVNLRAHDEGTAEMIEKAAIIRAGAKTFLRRQDRAIIVVVGTIGVSYMLLYGISTGLCLWMGSLLSRAAVEVGMRGATYGNVRTANAARVTEAISRTLRIALLSGSLSGFTVPSFGMFGFLIVFLASGGPHSNVVCHGIIPGLTHNAVTAHLIAYSLGCSLVAMFNRVAGGVYTKSADIAADIVGKRNYSLEEDDPRNVCTIADLVGDDVNDVAGNVSDLLESFVATPLSCILIGMQNFASDEVLLAAACAYPFILAGSGLVATLSSIMYVILKNRKRYKWVTMTLAELNKRYPLSAVEPMPKVRERKDGLIDVRTEYSLEIEDPGHELNVATVLSAVVVLLAGLYGTHAVFSDLELPASFRMGWISPWVAAAIGIIASVAIGKITEYYTSAKYGPVQELAMMAINGETAVVSGGKSLGQRSVLPTAAVIVAMIVVACRACGIYGIAISGVGMVSFVGTIVSIDAFGPTADNAGGIAEACGLDPYVRAITDQADALGNTTAAQGKGEAIGAAAAAVVPLIMTYIGSFELPDFSDPEVWALLLAGAVLGSGVIQRFMGILMQNTSRASSKLHAEAERQLKIPGVLEGTKRPDYLVAIELAADNALRYMVTPSILSFMVPLIVGFTFSNIMVLGLLIGSAIVAIEEAIKNSNAGGAKDNAKKYIEMGELNVKMGLPREATGEGTYGKGSAAHKAAIVGDTTGDPEKDVLAVSLDISIKTMSTVSNSMAPMFLIYSIF